MAHTCIPSSVTEMGIAVSSLPGEVLYSLIRSNNEKHESVIHGDSGRGMCVGWADGCHSLTRAGGSLPGAFLRGKRNSVHLVPAVCGCVYVCNPFAHGAAMLGLSFCKAAGLRKVKCLA